MKKHLLILIFAPLLLLAQPKVSLQVLGSGGPEIGDKRASSGYIVWIDGKSRVLVDFGGGASLRFEEAGAKIEDLDVILLTHLHILTIPQTSLPFSNQVFLWTVREIYLFLVPKAMTLCQVQKTL